MLLWLAGCQAGPAEPVPAGARTAPGGSRLLTVAEGVVPSGLPAGGWPAQTSRWRWDCPSGEADQPGGARVGTAVLELGPTPGGCAPPTTFRWVFTPALSVLPPGAEIRLIPADTSAWLGMVTRPDQWPWAGSPVPLAHWALAGPPYAHVVALLQALTADLFEGRVRHWPKLPVPVRTGQAQSGAVDLAACLAEAVAIWNEGEPEPWFRLDPEAAWGVRLVHFPGVMMHPPLQARLTRLDETGRPLRVNIVVGDNYDDPVDRRYALRGMVHELGHALLLWGHSADRRHVLWESGPPLVDAPSLDERKAARLWHGLPEGLDLDDYFSGRAARTETWPPDARP